MTVEYHGREWRFVFSYKGTTYRARTGVTSNTVAGRNEALRIEKEARLQAAIEHQQVAGTVKAAVPTLAEAIVRYDAANSVNVDEKTAIHTLKSLMWCADQLGRSRLVTDITDEDIQQLITLRAKSTVGKKAPRPISKTTINRAVIAPMRQMMGWVEKKAKVRGMHVIDWADLTLEEPKPRERVISAKERQSIREIAEREDDGRLVALDFALMSGLRLENFTLLKWSNVDFAQTEQYPNGKVTVIQKRGREHTIPMTVEMRELLERQKGKHPEQVFTFKYTDREKWTNPKNGEEYVKGEIYPVTYWGFVSFFERVAKKAGVKNVRPHDLRKTAGSEILNASGNLVAAQKLLGHSTPAQTAKAYAFLGTDVLLSAMETASKRGQ